ncbi:hypothetical protein GUA87_00495 [Sneathiella sp. P13V-1]|uniref:hypothetical protein n=1 Tax=Sneathiella sp. P13V-1 TaxID=2697366 RepID=UPI00187B51D1|nr:hypothetical protein [Sneathiella sp. P13V-1]MBE7635306.1 hypothetical protein [Sneathiella sp. P13V-1]
MLNRRTIGITLLIPFGALTIYALLQHGYIGLIEFQLSTPAGWQVFADLVISLLLVMGWLLKDARDRGLAFWPWFVGTLFLGAIVPLIYLIVSHNRAPVDQETFRERAIL